jgi:hypothetical protein
MAKITIIADDGVVGVDGVFRAVDLSALDPNIHAVQWDGAKGHVEFKDHSPATKLSDISQYQAFIDAWAAAAPLPPTLAELNSAKRQEFIAEGVIRIAAQVPDWDSIGSVKTAAGMWPAIGGGATAAMLLAKDIYLYVRDTVPAKLAAVPSQAELEAIDPAQADPFGDGTGWPT